MGISAAEEKNFFDFSDLVAMDVKRWQLTSALNFIKVVMMILLKQ